MLALILSAVSKVGNIIWCRHEIRGTHFIGTEYNEAVSIAEGYIDNN